MLIVRARLTCLVLIFAACSSTSEPDARPLSRWLQEARGAPAASVADVSRWRPAPVALTTRFGRELDPRAPWPEYPRTQFVRERWQSLNGLWEFANAREDESPPFGRTLEHQILVPFAMESSLSGIGAHSERAWYRRTFDVPPQWSDGVKLHFEASDWETSVWLNGQELGTHRGGYGRFSFDIGPFLRDDGAQELVVGIFDPTSAGDQPRGKQTLHPEGIWYTPTSGIWQSVWMEPVPPAHVERVHIEPSLARAQVEISAEIAHPDDAGAVALDIVVRSDGKEVARVQADLQGHAVLALPNARAWSPSDPHLYDVELVLRAGTKVLDRVSSYFGLRDIAVRADEHGVPRVQLNGAPLFQMGVLDQGFWPDGLYTAPSDAALKSDIELARELGFNLIRKHVKVEPERWYTWCDRLGMLVWQDMPSADDHRPADVEILRRELDELIEQRGNHPCIVDWVVFNEGWGQFGANSGHADEKALDEGTRALTARVKKLDPSRLVTAASGWTDIGAGDLRDIHVYPGPAAPPIDRERAAVLGEFGGLGLPVQGHTWDEKSWGYRGVSDSEALTRSYEALLRRVYELAQDEGLCAAVYTQLTDVESECNGLITYDRAVTKVDVARVSRANRGKLPRPIALVADGRTTAVEWQYTTDAPADERWWARDFDASAWKRGAAGFGAEGTPGARVRTPWTSSDIWLRRDFELDARGEGELALVVHHDENCEIHLNGAQVPLKLTGYTTGYELVNLPAGFALENGRNSIAVHCHQTTGGQYIDVGVVRLPPAAD